MKKLNKTKVTLLIVVVILLFAVLINLNFSTKIKEQQKQIDNLTDTLIEKENQYKLLQDEYNSVLQDNAYLEGQVEELNKWRELGTFRITCYWLGEDDYGALSNFTRTLPEVGSDLAQENHTIAVDPNVIPYGSIILIDGNEYIAEDCGGAVKNNVIDVWVRHKSNSFGVKYTKVYIKEE